MDGDPLGFPGYTEWSSRPFCCFEIQTIPALRSVFWGHWEVRIFIPAGIFVFSLSSLLLVLIGVLPAFGTEGWLMTPLFVIFFLLFQGHYFRTIFEGPGYFPFYWADQDILPPPPDSRSMLLFQEDSPYGIISNDRQLAWAANRPKPPRCIVSRSARRIVLRPDQFCTWTTVWIGKRNSKFFIMLNLYSFLYLVLFVVYVARRFAALMSGPVQFMSFLMAIYGLAAAAFSLTNFAYFVASIGSALTNRTSWEQWKSIDPRKFDHGWRDNLEDVCGERRKWWTWPCPVSPWKGRSNSDLLQGYTTYFD
jgi:hypothetical protein